MVEFKHKKTKVASKKAPIPDDPRILSRHLKSLGYFLGADIMGIGKVPESSFYSNDMQGKPINPTFKNAIVFVVRKSDRSIRASNGWDWIMDPASLQAYERVGFQSECLASYLRKLGYAAEAQNTYRYSALLPHILLEAGIGEVCRMGIVLNPFIGTNFKAACVLTNLDLELDGPIDFGLQKYCTSCKICAQQCPANAITKGEKTIYNGYYTWKLNLNACQKFCFENKEGNICGRCTKVCPWHRPNSEPRNFVNWDGNIKELHKLVNEQRVRLKNNNFVDPLERTSKWWFPLVTVKDQLVVPTLKNPQKICREHPLALKKSEHIS
jgi:ferredoxin